MELLSVLGLLISCYYAAILIPGLRRTKFFSDLVTTAISTTSTTEQQNLPLLSVIIAARNEAPHIEATLQRLMATKYSNLEIIVVNDRSEDDTGPILKDLAHRHARIKVVDIEQLPEDWLGKVHALYCGYEHSQGEWLCFTDADVTFNESALLGAWSIAQQHKLDHLTVYPELITTNFFERLFVSTIWFFLFLHAQPWAVNEPASRRYCGFGAFNFIRRDVYEAIGTHQRLRYDLLDDMKLGKLVKAHGFRQDAFNGRSFLKLRWQKGSLRSYIRGLEKNAFPGLDFKISILLATTVALTIGNIFPYLASLILEGLARWMACATIAVLFASHKALQKHTGHSTGWVLLHPLGCTLMLVALWRSAILALRHRAVEWRGTRYPLDKLRKHLV